MLMLEQYCIPNNSSVQSQLIAEMHAIKILLTETGTQYIARFKRRLGYAVANRVVIEPWRLVNMLLDGFGTCTRDQHLRYGVTMSLFESRRTNEHNPLNTRHAADVLTLVEIERTIDAIDLRYSNMQHAAQRTGTGRPQSTTPSQRPQHWFQQQPQSSNSVRVANGSKFKVSCWECGGDHHMKDHPGGVSEERRKVLFEKHRAELDKARSNRQNGERTSKSGGGSWKKQPGKSTPPANPIRQFPAQKSSSASAAHVQWTDQVQRHHTANFVIEEISVPSFANAEPEPEPIDIQFEIVARDPVESEEPPSRALATLTRTRRSSPPIYWWIDRQVDPNVQEDLFTHWQHRREIYPRKSSGPSTSEESWRTPHTYDHSLWFEDDSVRTDVQEARMTTWRRYTAPYTTPDSDCDTIASSLIYGPYDDDNSDSLEMSVDDSFFFSKILRSKRPHTVLLLQFVHMVYFLPVTTTARFLTRNLPLSRIRTLLAPTFRTLPVILSLRTRSNLRWSLKESLVLCGAVRRVLPAYVIWSR